MKINVDNYFHKLLKILRPYKITLKDSKVSILSVKSNLKEDIALSIMEIECPKCKNIRYMQYELVRDVLRALVNDYADSLTRKKLLKKSLDEYVFAILELAIPKEELREGMTEKEYWFKSSEGHRESAERYLNKYLKLKAEHLKLRTENDELEGTNRMWKDEMNRLKKDSKNWVRRSEVEKYRHGRSVR